MDWCYLKIFHASECQSLWLNKVRVSLLDQLPFTYLTIDSVEEYPARADRVHGDHASIPHGTRAYRNPEKAASLRLRSLEWLQAHVPWHPREPNRTHAGTARFWSWCLVNAIIESPNTTVVTTGRASMISSRTYPDGSFANAKLVSKEVVFKIRLNDLPYAGDYCPTRVARMELAVCVFTCQKHMCPDQKHGWGGQEHGYLYCSRISVSQV